MQVQRRPSVAIVRPATCPPRSTTASSQAAAASSTRCVETRTADPVARCALVALTDRTFDEWSADALRMWPELSDAVLAEVAGG